MHVKEGHYRPTSEMPSGWRFAGGPTVARNFMLSYDQQCQSACNIMPLSVGT